MRRRGRRGWRRVADAPRHCARTRPGTDSSGLALHPSTARSSVGIAPETEGDMDVSELFDPGAWAPVEGFDLRDVTYHRSVEPGTVRVAFNRPEVRNAFRPA